MNSQGPGVLFALLLFIGLSVWLSIVAQKRIAGGQFLKGYFLGNRGLGAWAIALTATVQSGGTFMGFPALVYSHGWIVSLWIASYMVVPLTGFAVLGKRFAQLSRRLNAITVPDLFRARFNSPAAGLTASLLIIIFMGAMMIAQFKAGAIVMKLAWPGNSSLELVETSGDFDRAYFAGLLVFSFSVIGYTLIGGFLASVWTDLFQSVMMLVGVLVLLMLVVPAAGGLEQATETAIVATGPGFASGPGYDPSGREFLTPGLALSFFFVWVFSGLSSPAGMVRVMAAENTEVIRRSIFLLSCYNVLIYLPLIAICIAGRALIPDLDKPDEIIPRLAIFATRNLPGGSLVTGLILAAPFGAVMATVSSYLLLISSSLVTDVYLRFLRPSANDRELRWVSYAAMLAVGVAAIAANISPVKYLQAFVVFSGTSAAAAFATPAIIAAYWRRGTVPGVISAMLAGSGTVFALFALGQLPFAASSQIGIAGSFRPYHLLGLDPVIWGLAVSAVVGVGVSLLTQPPAEEILAPLFTPPGSANAERKPGA